MPPMPCNANLAIEGGRERLHVAVLQPCQRRHRQAHRRLKGRCSASSSQVKHTHGAVAAAHRQRRSLRLGPAPARAKQTDIASVSTQARWERALPTAPAHRRSQLEAQGIAAGGDAAHATKVVQRRHERASLGRWVAMGRPRSMIGARGEGAP